MIHAVVVAYRSAEHIGGCVRSILADPLVRSVAVVDNSSDPATRNICHSLNTDGRIEYVASPNRGYAHGCNVGAALAPQDSRFLAVVNPDVVLIRSLSELAEQTSCLDGTVYSARLHDPPNLNARPMAGPWLEFLNALVGSRAYRRRWAGGQGRHGFVRVPQIDGSLMLVPVPESTELGGFDERFELYFEDVDYCRRANLRGGCHIQLEAWGHHAGGASFTVSGAPPFIALRVSRMRYLRKWYGARGVATGLAIGFVEAGIRSVIGSAPSRRVLVRALRAQCREVREPGRGTYLAA